MKDYVVCLPVEVAKRELLAKIYLGAKAALADFPVIVGEHQSKVFGKIKSGFYLYKDHAPWSDKRFYNIKNQGLEFASLDEEGLIYFSETKYRESRCSEIILNESDYVFCWGDKQKKILDFFNDKYQVTGNPRFDLACLLSKSSANSQNGKISVLVNTRFPSCNPLRGKREMDNLKTLNVIKSQEDELKYFDFMRQDLMIYEEFIKLLKLFSFSGEFDVVIRPHPNESLEPYFLLEKELGIKVDNETELLRQIMNSHIVIHDGCTTAIEAKLAGRIILGLRPSSVSHDYGLFANSFSMNFESAENLFSFIVDNKDLGLNSSFAIDDVLASSYMVNWNKNYPHSTNMIVSAIEKCFERACGENDWVAILSAGDGFKNKIKKSIYGNRRLFNYFPWGERIQCLVNEISILQHKFPSLTLDSITESVDFLREIDPTLPELSITMIGEKAFMIKVLK